MLVYVPQEQSVKDRHHHERTTGERKSFIVLRVESNKKNLALTVTLFLQYIDQYSIALSFFFEVLH